MKKLIFKTHKSDSIQAKLFNKFMAENKGVEIIFEPEPEEGEIGQYMEPDDLERWQKQLEQDSELQTYGVSPRLFCAHVAVKYKGFEADDYLGQCSYSSYEEFKAESGYYYGMISECIDQINKDIEAHNEGICNALKFRRLKNLATEMGYYLVPKTAIQ